MLIDLHDIYGHDDDVTDVTDEAVSQLGEFDKWILLLISLEETNNLNPKVTCTN